MADMDVSQLLAIIAGFCAVAGVVSGIIIRDRQMQRSISKIGEDFGRNIDQKVNELHERVNRVRDEYVKRIDLDAHIKRLEQDFRDLRDEIRTSHKENTALLHQLLSHTVKENHAGKS